MALKDGQKQLLGLQDSIVGARKVVTDVERREARRAAQAEKARLLMGGKPREPVVEQVVVGGALGGNGNMPAGMPAVEDATAMAAIEDTPVDADLPLPLLGPGLTRGEPSTAE
jgi:hypothetical protein